MSVHTLTVYLHVIGAFIMFGGLMIEIIGFDRLRKATTTSEVAGSLSFFRALPTTYPIAATTLLVTGLYLTISEWGWHGWIVVSLVMLTAIAAVGSTIGGKKYPAIGMATARTPGGVSDDLRRLLDDRVLSVSLFTRSGVALGIVYLMVAKPPLVTSLIAIAVMGLAGLLVARSR